MLVRDKVFLFTLVIIVSFSVWVGSPKLNISTIAGYSEPQFARASESTSLNVTISPKIVKEGNDFATQVLTDPWDMNEYSDISRNINESNVIEHLVNLEVSNGIFSAKTSSSDAQFYTLFPGYSSSIDSINIPVKSGSLFPIQSSKYHCIFTRMKVETTEPYDDIRMFWFADKNLGYGQFGVTKRVPILDTSWHIYSADFNLSYDAVNSNTHWSELATWQGLRIDPTKYDGVNIAVDWVRLTDCTSVNTTITWQPTNGEVEIWAGIGATNPDFMVDSVNGPDSHYALDVQGWQPGVYYLGVRDYSGEFSWSDEPLVIDPAPLFHFNHPSFESGEQITWEMNNSGDLDTNPLVGTRCVDYSFDNGLINLLTLPHTSQPTDCKYDLGNGVVSSDPQLVLTMQTPQVDTSSFRYLTIRTHMDGSIPDVNRGWVFRWLWKTITNNDPQKWCINVSNDIVFDPGWQTIIIDLHDPGSGITEDWVGPGDCHVRYWQDDPATWLRFDINENATNSTFYQKIDWISLSQIDKLVQGELYSINIESSEEISDLILNFYYTTDSSNPTQNPVNLSTPTTPAGDHLVYLPIVLDNSGADQSDTIQGTNFNWDTSEVPAGTYYICAVANDGLNQIHQCSLAPLEVITH